MEKKKLYGIIAVIIVVASLAAVMTQPTLTVAGSTTCLPIVESCATAYQSETGERVQVSAGGSSVGVSSVGEGQVDIGMASRPPKDEEIEQYSDMKWYYIGMDGVAIVVNEKNGLSNIDEKAAYDIFTGAITKWDDVSGSGLTGEISVVCRDASSGTRETIDKALDMEDTVSPDQELNSNGAIAVEVGGNEKAIGYVGIGYVSEEGLKALKFEGVTPKKSTIQSLDYGISRFLHVMTKGTADAEEKAFIDFIQSDAGQDIVEDQGFVELPEGVTAPDQDKYGERSDYYGS